ncbi:MULTISPECIES: aldo/keto reductase [unclassified Pseudoalteromonas]|uniref:aldo/keto reductase n=1 Tax=unclassified Pseudoalteromonas TaxID=194690 RepID=UPI000B6CF830|nr:MULTISPECIES: aldo/keto reductase [unclassified Pseudoalteromonas]MAJ39390.1 aldo/keto reductase [Pseudoalteromonadaceae bacterium]OUX90742.1 MAG: aldo/keto reductase [Pseudoalteromonas sp. TMED43]MDC9565986.1 aldo/keto reductase [Pseudoalteromonas sp. GAB2316C]MDC9570319.1 aldo/keto reductase [Pseudoalteromonas sp. GABNB9D]MDC9574462.1 aldo/keto reductase [Pseudoalteromonas sp. GABNS16A]
MLHTPLAKHLPHVSRLVFGCMGLGGGWNKDAITKAHLKQTHECIDAAIAGGINFFDHADIYTFGKAEQVFGQALAERPELREHMYIQSKCGIRFEDDKGPKRYDFSAKWIEESVEGSLKRLNTDYLDVLMLHRPDPLMEVEEIAQVFSCLQESGKVRNFAVSNMQQHQMNFLQHALDMPIVANQIEASLQKHQFVDEGVYAGNADGKDLNFTPGSVEYCRHFDIQIQSWGSLCQGLYTGGDLTNASQADINTSILVNKLAALYDTTPEAIVLAWLLRHPALIQPIIGTTNVERIAASCGALNVTLSREHWYALYVSAKGHELP